MWIEMTSCFAVKAKKIMVQCPPLSHAIVFKNYFFRHNGSVAVLQGVPK